MRAKELQSREGGFFKKNMEQSDFGQEWNFHDPLVLVRYEPVGKSNYQIKIGAYCKKLKK